VLVMVMVMVMMMMIMMMLMIMMMTMTIIILIMMMFTTIIAWRNGLVNCYDLLRLLILSLSLKNIYIIYYYEGYYCH
jgi:hypothetical protein